jgi:molecular chaperone GrpE
MTAKKIKKTDEATVTPEVEAAVEATENAEDSLETTETVEAAEAVEASETEEQEQTLEEQIKALEDAVALAEDKTLRLQAEFQNYRKRTFKDISSARQLAIADTAQPFLQVFDHFNMAVDAAKKGDNMDAILQGMDMILSEYGKALDELGIKQFNAVGEKFDPELHQAVANEASDEIADGIIIRQWSSGYKMGEKLMRPAMVVVSSGPEEIPEELSEEAQEATEDAAEPATEPATEE